MNGLKYYKVVPVIKTADYNAGVDGDSINCGKARRVTFIMTFGAITGNAILKIYSGATDGAKTSALTFKYALGSAAIGSASCDVLGTESTSAALTLTGTTYADKMMIVEVDMQFMDADNNEEWLTMEISADASAGILHVVALVEPRYIDGTTMLT